MTRDTIEPVSTLESFHPAVRSWFAECLGQPTEPQRRGWPVIAGGEHTLIAAPTGTGKTLAAFLYAIDHLLRQGPSLGDHTRVLYVSPLKALSNDVQKNLQQPLAAIRELDPSLPEVRVLVRTGDTPSSVREAMKRKPPHILVTTPESLYILLTSAGGREMLSTVETVIVDEIHALAGDKRGSHLSLSLERLDRLVDGVQRIGLSATQKPIEEISQFLVGAQRKCHAIDVGHLRELDIAIEVPPSPLTAVCSHEVWAEIYDRIVELIQEHSTTLVFVNTRKLAERISAQLRERMEGQTVLCHHSSLSKERRLAAEQALKNGELKALVATASLELGIDIGDVDLVIQIGSTRSIATFLQRVGRSGHVLGAIPKGRLFPLTRDELAEAVALMTAVREKQLDRIVQPKISLDVLAQQIVAACASEEWAEDELFDTLRRSAHFQELTREQFNSVIELHTRGRYALLHRDGVGKRLLPTRRSRLTAIQSGGAIPDTADYQVVQEPHGTVVGTLNEDFAIESSAGDIFQLGNTSWQILRVHNGKVLVADARGAPPTVPFWFGEAPARTDELSAVIARQREEFLQQRHHPERDSVSPAATRQLQEYHEEITRDLGTIPTNRRIVAERFFDESGGMQLILHAPLGARVNRAWGLSLRKRFCRGFGFELQAAANEEAVLLSLGLQNSFPLDEVFEYLHPGSARKVLVQALLDTPMFETRWRWNVTRSLLVERMRNGKRVPPPLQRFRADDLLAEAFPQLVACGENLPPGDLPVPEDHPLVMQTIEDCLNEAMDINGFIQFLTDLRSGAIERVAVDTPQPSSLAQSILNAQPYSFLDDAPLEERRTQAVLRRRTLDKREADDIGALDPEAIARVREEAWPDPECAEEVHEALLWMGYVTDQESEPWRNWLQELAEAGRVMHQEDRWYAAEASRDPKIALRGRMEALGPIVSSDPLLIELESEGVVLRTRFDGSDGWCDRRLLARIRRYTLERLRSEIAPITTTELLRFIACWHGVAPGYQFRGPRGVAQVIDRLAGFETSAQAWEKQIFSARVESYEPNWLDDLCQTGEVTWGRLWGESGVSIRTTPIAIFPREQLDDWLALAKPAACGQTGATGQVRAAIESRGALFREDIEKRAGLLSSQVDMALGELVAGGVLTCDSYRGLRRLLFTHRRRRERLRTGRWCRFREESTREPERDPVEFVVERLLARNGVVFRKLVERERIPLPWRDLVRHLRTLEARGTVRGGRFVERFTGEQFALPEAVELMRKVRRQKDWSPVRVSAADPLNWTGILLPGDRVPSTSRDSIVIE